ncbi:polymer-forming cytoskeletal protein [Heyndrickxia coagulans]|uniref:polymer-forming cytoskeletal protein n=1 Tax=Heyndrickxia coagulans TaxID=1398 RepID=UPI002E24D36C|nr:polymer-forming cytoskeletal protein [Heyndrickxia coagulans]
MHVLKEEKGYTLVTVLLIFAVAAIITVSLVSASVSTFKTVKVSETGTQDKLNAEMVADEATALIEKQVDSINSVIATGTVMPSQLISMLQAAITNIQQQKNGKCSIEYKTLKDGTAPDGIVLGKVTISVPVGKSGKTLTKVMTLSTVSDVFQYTAVTPSNMYLYGSPYIIGDVNIGGNLYVSNYGNYREGYTNYWNYIEWYTKYIQTYYPAINGTLTVKGRYYEAGQQPVGKGISTPVYNFYSWNTFGPESFKKYFSVAPVVKNRQLTVDKINIGDMITAKALKWPENVKINSYDSYNIDKNGNAFGYDVTASQVGSQPIKGNLYVGDDLIVGKNKSLTVNGDLYVKDVLIVKGNLTVKGKIYVGGNADLNGVLSTGADKYIYIAGDATLSDVSALNLNGVMYVNGSLTSRGDVNTNGSIYVRGNADVENFSNSNGTLILLCDGNIQLANNNLYKDNPKVIDAYLYSNSNLFIYGIGSNLKINGGIYGNTISLSASRGSTIHNPIYDELEFQNPQPADPAKSRLTVNFKKDMILNPPKGIPTVNKVTLKEINTSVQ